VSKSGFYEWRDRAPSDTQLRRQELKAVIAFIFAESDGT
jgi:putative transposase